jgi:hypothetical protein
VIARRSAILASSGRAMSISERASPCGGTTARVNSTVGPDGMNDTSSSSSVVVFGSTMSACSAVGVMACAATATKSSDRSASMVRRVSG